VGVLAYELLSGRAPFEGTDDETKSRIATINYTFPENFSQLARRFIENVCKTIFIAIDNIERILSFVESFYKRILNDVCH
jgi:hypothetical protein